jgi:predicted Zn-dependent peptidase
MKRTNLKSILFLLSLLACSSSASRLTPSPASIAVDQIEIQSETLPSGYRAIIARTPPVPGRVPRIYVGSYVLHGTMQEDRFGWAHLIEHVVANNRSTIAGPPRPQGVEYIEGNALTRPYYTSFVSVLPSPLLAYAIHTRMARAGRAENDSQVFTTQVGRVLDELDRDMKWVYPAYKAAVAMSIGQSPRLADEINLVRTTNRQELAAAIAPIYRPDNAILVITGDLNIDSTRAIIRETDARLRLSELRSGAAPAKVTPTLRMNQSAVVERQNRTRQHIVAIAWAKPPLGHPDQLPLLIADQLLLGRGSAVDDPVRSDSSAIAIRLARALGGSGFWDGRAGRWGAPDLIDTGPGVHAIVFKTDRKLTVDQVRDSVTGALRDVAKNSMSDAEIEIAKENLASFYERWLFEPLYRVLSDHLMAYVATGRDPNLVKQIPSQIRRIRPSAVRDAHDRYFVKGPSNVVILPPEQEP